jgi:hypothetical protein
MHIYDYYVYRTESKPTGDSNKVFPRYLADHKGKIDAYEIGKYPEMTRYIHTVEINTNGVKRYELV